MATTGVRPTGQPAGATARTDNPFAADEHALIITGEKVFLPSHREVPTRSAMDSIEKLRELILWAWNPNRKQKLLRPKGAAPQVWVVGEQACDQLGWLPPEPPGWDEMPPAQRRLALASALETHVQATLWPFLDNGWELRGEPGPRIRLSQGRSMVDIVLEPFAWVAQGSDKGNILGDFDADDDADRDDADADAAPEADHHDDAPTPISTALPDDDVAAARELGRRLAASVQHLTVLPSESAGRTGAAIADAIWRARGQRGQGLVIDRPGPIPALDNPLPVDEDYEPAVEFTRPPQLVEVAEFTTDEDGTVPATEVIELDQRGSYLGSASIDLGYGEPVHLSGDAAVAAIRKAWHATPKSKPIPFGLYRVTLPAGDELATPNWLPLPHPAMRADRRVQAWTSGVSVEWLCKPIEDGGAGLELDDLDIEQAWLCPEQGRALDAWTKVLRDARAHFEASGDQAMLALTKAIYQMYIGRMKRPDNWQSRYMAHHHQPMWRDAIMAHARWRTRTQAMRIYQQHQLRPFQVVVDALIYLIGPDQHGQLPDLEDHSGRLGQLRVKQRVVLTPERWEALVVAILGGTRARDVSRALATVFKPTEESA